MSIALGGGLAGCGASSNSTAPPLSSATGNQSSSGVSTPAHRSDVVIAAFEATPEDPMPGGELVYLMNDGPAPVDIDCWSLTSQSLGRTLRVLDAEELAPGAAVRLLADTPFIAPVDRLKLSDSTGAVIDRTPRLADDAGDDRIWYRTGDGSWEFGRDANLPDGISDGRLAVDSQLC